MFLPLARSGLKDGNLELNPSNKTMKNFKSKSAILSAVLVLAATSVSQAVPTLRIQSGATIITVTDGGAGDADPLAGSISYTAPAGTFANWSVVFSGGITKPVIGSTTAPELDLNWNIVRTAGSGSGSITAMFSENGFNLATAKPFVTSSGGTLGTAANSATVNTFYAGNDTVLATTTPLTTHVFNGPGAFAANDNGVAPADPTVAFTIVLTLTQGAGQITSGDIHLSSVNVPEGGSMVTFLGTALLGLGAFAARRKS